MKKKTTAGGLSLAGFFLCPVLTFILTESYNYNPFTDMKPVVWLLNGSVYWLFAAVLVMLTGRLRMALRLQTLFSMTAGLANYYVLEFRSSPILPWDIFSARTAASVADNFSYALPGRVRWVLSGFALLLVIQQIFRGRVTGRRQRLAGMTAAVLLLFGLAFCLHQDEVISGLRLYDKMFTPGVVQKRNGSAVAFMMEMKYLMVEKPSGYDAKACEGQLKQYGTEPGSGAAEEEKPPNIIVIMDEAFSDPACLGAFSCNQAYMPYFHSLQGAEHTITGTLHVSVLGGNTANTEFEFLTGNTMAFLPQGSIPYQQYIRGRVPSLVSLLQEAGYQCIAMHPYHAKGWNRNQVYPWLGFGEVRFLEDYQDPELVRKYVSDSADFQQIITEYEQRDKSRPLFLFNVTMQNHGGYGQEFVNFTPGIHAQDIQSAALSDYLSLLSLTDQALSDLIGYFAREKERTIVVFFGDHQPGDAVAAPIFRAGGINPEALTREQEASRYQVPFLLWANFEIEEKQEIETSANFLALEVLRQADLPLNGYYGYLETLQRKYPVISAKQVQTAAGERLTDEEREASQELLTYQKLQYYRMFDAEGIHEQICE